MERWVPLFDIFLNSRSPEGEASSWFQQQHPHHQQQQSSPLPCSTSAFLSLLLAPVDIIASRGAGAPTATKKGLWIETLPYMVQSRILSFLAIDNRRFCHGLLCSLATRILDDSAAEGREAKQGDGGFWVERAAQQLLDEITANSLVGTTCNVRIRTTDEDEEEMIADSDADEDDEGEEEEFDSLPDWLAAAASTTDPVLPWLPMSQNQLHRKPRRVVPLLSEKTVNDLSGAGGESEQMEEEPARVQPETIMSDPLPLSSQTCERVLALKSELQSEDLPSNAVRVSNDIRQLCIDSGEGNISTIMTLIEPWEVDDETSLVLSSNLLDSGIIPAHSTWPSHVFSAVTLPKLLTLRRSPASRVLLSSTVDFCKNHQKEAVTALLFPLIYNKEGINAPQCDVLSRVMRECLHPSHASAFFRRLLCSERVDMDFLCLPCHRSMLSTELVWTESMFSLFHNLVSGGVHLTPDAVDKLVSVLGDMDGKFKHSLRFGSLLLSLVTKSEHAVKFHGDSLRKIAEKTETFLSKSIISKMADQ